MADTQILTVVLGGAALARRGVPGGSAAGYLDQIEQACRRAADVCRQLLAYAGRSDGAGTRVYLPALVRESAPLLRIPAALPCGWSWTSACRRSRPTRPRCGRCWSTW